MTIFVTDSTSLCLTTKGCSALVILQSRHEKCRTEKSLITDARNGMEQRERIQK